MKLAGEEGGFCCSLQIFQCDIINSIQREMSGDLREGIKTVGKRKIGVIRCFLLGEAEL